MVYWASYMQADQGQNELEMMKKQNDPWIVFLSGRQASENFSQG